MKSTHRVFFAIELSPQIKTQLITYQESLKAFYPVSIQPENFHITLSFLGKLTNRKIETLIDELPAFKQPSFKVEITEPIYFTKTKVLALAIKEGQQQLTTVKEKLETQLKSIDHFDLEKRQYIPHISLFREVESSEEQFPNINLEMMVDALSLFESVSSPKGVRYHLIEQWPFKQTRSVKEQLLGNRY